MTLVISFLSSPGAEGYHRFMQRDQRAFAMDMAMGPLTREAAP
jgi:hypothetical protein